MRFGIGYDRIYTYKEIGTYVNRSHERIRQIQNDILKEFKNKLGEDNG